MVNRKVETDTTLVVFDGDFTKLHRDLSLLVHGHEKDRLYSDPDWFTTEEAELELLALLEGLNLIAPEGFYFGAHHIYGDEYGFWSKLDTSEE